MLVKALFFHLFFMAGVLRRSRGGVEETSLFGDKDGASMLLKKAF